MTTKLFEDNSQPRHPDIDMTVIDLAAEIEGVTGTAVGMRSYDPRTGESSSSSYFCHYGRVSQRSNGRPGLPAVSDSEMTQAEWQRYQDEKWRRFREEMQPVVKEAADGFSR